MRDARHITLKPVSGISFEQELDTLGRVYAFILQKHHERKKAACGCRPDDAEGESNGIRATENYTGSP